MNKILALCCAAAGLAGFSATSAQAAAPVANTLPTIAHINETVVVVRRHHRHRGHWVYRHHHRVWVRY